MKLALLKSPWPCSRTNHRLKPLLGSNPGNLKREIVWKCYFRIVIDAYIVPTWAGSWRWKSNVRAYSSKFPSVTQWRSNSATNHSLQSSMPTICLKVKRQIYRSCTKSTHWISSSNIGPLPSQSKPHSVPRSSETQLMTVNVTLGIIPERKVQH